MKKHISWKNLISVTAVLCLVLSTAIFIRTLLFSLKVMTAETPQELRENAIVLTTELLLKGENPFTLEKIPSYVNSHGILYNLIILPFAKIFGSSYFLHRFFSVLFIEGAVAVFYFYLRLLKVGKILSIICCGFLFGQIVVGGFDITARADSLGFLLFLLSVFVPRKNDFSRKSLFFGLVFSFAAFLTKQYFILGIACLFLFLFLFRSKIIGMLYIYITIVLTFLLVVAVWIVYPTYFFNTIYILLGQAGNDREHLINQTQLFWDWNKGIILILTASILPLLKMINKMRREKRLSFDVQKIFDFSNPDKPLIKLHISFETVALIVSLIVVFLKLGLHPGQSMVYFYHLITPFLLLTVFSKFSQQKDLKIHGLFLALILINLFSFYKGWVLNLPEEIEYRQEWHRLRNYINQYNRIYNSPETAYLVYKGGKPVYDNGHSGFVTYGLLVNDKYPLFVKVKDHYQNFVKEINEKIKEKKFDLIIVTRYLLPYFSLETLSTYYQSKEIIPIRMYKQQWSNEIWIPK